MEPLDKLLYFFILLFAGYGAARKQLLPESLADGIPALLMHLCYPAMIVYTFASINLSRQWEDSLRFVLSALGISVILILGARIFLRSKPPVERNFLQFMLSIGNLTYIGIPIFSIFLPDSVLSLFILLGSMQDFLIWLYFYPSILSVGRPLRLKELLCNPCILSLSLGLILTAFSLPLPSFLQLSLRGLSEMTMPLAALYLSLLLARHGIRAPLHNASAARYACVKTILIPLGVVLLLLPFLGIRASLLLSLFFACPAPLISLVWARQHHMNLQFVSDCCILSTLLFLPLSGIALILFTMVFQIL